MTREDIFYLCTISIEHNGIVYSFEKPKAFRCELLKVRLGRYHNIIALVIDEYNNSIAICYSTEGFVHDGREGFDKFTLKPTNIDTFFKVIE